MSGRLNRLAYFLRVFAISIVTNGIGFAAISASPEAGAMVSIVASLVGAVFSIYFAIGRFHDMEMSGWYNFGFIVPFYNIYLALILLFKRGTDGANQYGPDPLTEAA